MSGTIMPGKAIGDCGYIKSTDIGQSEITAAASTAAISATGRIAKRGSNSGYQ